MSSPIMKYFAYSHLAAGAARNLESCLRTGGENGNGYSGQRGKIRKACANCSRRKTVS
jgi:hypothetical protein